MRKMRAMAMMLAGLVSVATPALAQMQPPDSAATRVAMERVRFIEGRWRGEAWWQMGPGPRVAATMVETVERRLDGLVMLIEGRGMTAVPGGGERVVHHALGVLSYDAVTKSYSLRSWIGTGQSGDFAVTVTSDALIWTREVPGGRVRNTARYTATEWKETGEFSRDGTTWSPIMEINLRKLP